jgi:tetratricopeptide (TPR) repeat protein
MRHAIPAGILLLGLVSCAPAPCPTLEEADRDYDQQDLRAAEAKYRHLLECDVPDPERLRALQRIGECFRRCGRFGEARAVFERVVAWPIAGESAHPWSYARNVKGWAQMGIGECFEAEGRWKEALDAYRDSHLKYPVRGDCGNGNHEQRERELENIARCIRRLEGE